MVARCSSHSLDLNECEKYMGILFTIFRLWFGLSWYEEYFGEEDYNLVLVWVVLAERNICMNVKSIWVSIWCD